jgi:cation diffusion facilitator CzcD-associated flavoprotein CzcO
MREPQSTPTLDVLIVGAGFAGLYMLYEARRTGLNALIAEASDSVGGTWYQNRYPGARVDIPSLEYSFGFDEALQQEWRWSERYASQPELLRYANHVADRFGLRDAIRFNCRVTSLRFDESAACWRVRGVDGESGESTWTARFVVMASGPLSSPNTPAFDGLDSFAGPVYHTAKWPNEPVDFTGQRVAIVGTGSSAVQAIPLIARQARELTVFQRTAAYTVPAHNGPLDPQYEARIKADYAGFRERSRRMRAGIGADWPPNAPSTLSVDDKTREAAFEERWRIGGFSLLGAFSDTMIDARANAFAAEFVRNKIRATLRDPRTAALLCPTHTLGCKRLCVDTGYYETFNRSNVQLIDVSEASADAIVGITPRGVRTKSRELEMDAIVLATGFDAMTGTLMRLDLRGRGGLGVQDKWRAGPLTYLGLMVAGFPNLFNVVGPGCPAAFTNVILAIEHQVNWIAQCIADLGKRGHKSIEATPAAEAAWVEHVNAVAQATLFLSCNSWYLGANIPGKPRMFMPLLGFPPYVDRCAEVARNGYEGFALA